MTAPARTLLPPVGHLADGNTLIRHPAEHGSWVWHPAKRATETAVLRFRLRFTLAQAATPLLHVTADQRFQLRCDGRAITFGPDRCDLEHWTVQSVALELAAGEHELEALAWFITEPDGSQQPPGTAVPPMAQVTSRGGFLLCAEGIDAAVLNTGEAAWTVENLTPFVAMARPNIPGYHDIGPSFTYDLERWPAGEPQAVAVVLPPLQANGTGVRRPGWCLYPAAMPEQERAPWSGGRARAVRAHFDDAPLTAADCAAPEIAGWQALFDGSAPLTVPANTAVTVLWDLDNYFCGYPTADLEGGRGALLELSWAEALYEEPSTAEVNGQSYKGNRDEIIDKVFVGIEDRWQVGAQPPPELPALWWRAGRYVRLRVRTAETPLTLKRVGMVTTGFPLGAASTWQSSDAEWDRLMPLFERAFRCAGHETWTDTPYYEQMCYVGDNVLTALANYAVFDDPRLSRRSVQLFDWSRGRSGFVAERYPSGWRQECLPFALLWVTMVRDYTWWRDEPAFVKGLLPGVRSLLAEFDGLAGDDGLLHYLPGWTFVDWVPEWRGGGPPGVPEGDSCIVNLHWVRALLAAAQVEETHGDQRLAERCNLMGREVFERVLARFWDSSRGLLLDTVGNDAACEHAQMFALLTGLLDEAKTQSCLEALHRGEGLAKATIYSSFYVLDALYRHGRSDEFHRRLDFWRGLPGQGFKNTPEAPEPTRSDAHAWGAHPAWHSLASIAGVRPDAPGFTRVRVAPCPGALTSLACTVAHPRGRIALELRFAETGVEGTVDLPPGTAGTFAWNGRESVLTAGRNRVGFAP